MIARHITKHGFERVGVIKCKKLAHCVQDACRINAGRFSAGSVTGLTRVPLFVLSTVDDNDVIVDDDDNNNNHNNNNNNNNNPDITLSMT